MSLETFATITDALVAAGRLKRRGDAYPAELGIKTNRMVPQPNVRSGWIADLRETRGERLALADGPRRNRSGRKSVGRVEQTRTPPSERRALA